MYVLRAIAPILAAFFLFALSITAHADSSAPQVVDPPEGYASYASCLTAISGATGR